MPTSELSHFAGIPANQSDCRSQPRHVPYIGVCNNNNNNNNIPWVMVEWIAPLVPLPTVHIDCLPAPPHACPDYDCVIVICVFFVSAIP